MSSEICRICGVNLLNQDQPWARLVSWPKMLEPAIPRQWTEQYRGRAVQAMPGRRSHSGAPMNRRESHAKHRKDDRKHGPLVWLERTESGRRWVRTDFPRHHRIEPVIHECDGRCILSHPQGFVP